MAASGGVLPKLARYATASVGPIGSAGAQFLLSLVLLAVLPVAAFGRFSFLLILAQLGMSLANALFCAPLLVEVARGDADQAARATETLSAASLLTAAAAFVGFLLAARAVGADSRTALCFAGFGALALLRWYGRAYAYAIARPYRTMASDLLYSTTLLAGTAGVALRPAGAEWSCFAVLLTATALGLLPFGRSYLLRQFALPGAAALRSYGGIWRAHAGWSLLGVLTTELTVNCHSYIVTLIVGAGAYAPIAATALLMRPITVVVNALAEFERAHFAREIGAGHFHEVRASKRLFRIVLMAAWLVTAAASALLLWRAPDLMFHGKYPLHLLVTGTALWLLVAGARLFHTPEGSLLQAAGLFRPLAWISVWTAGISILAVLATMALGGAIWSIGGIVLGESSFALWLWIAARRYLAQADRTVTVPHRHRLFLTGKMP